MNCSSAFAAKSRSCELFCDTSDSNVVWNANTSVFIVGSTTTLIAGEVG
jgi:hypothetical protein